ncbi:ergot alkaloid biosynthesis protein [Nocardioides marmoriginsengisoli]|uniref:Ergot alkaloid biosynthesis protein n=1 Tax=Nocardioides marmoriginsengisoli TaxID=661483 RepID=A0A3N0CGQ9_9ACTN|nr:NAD(P)H-binding protein [Nocardioides marmoriginsengisoli]RNL62499.1 ergot alkaloid biosynthesis protein [Nocardioides marmoriginsengisoli]
MSAPILVTGATGKTGVPLVAALAERGIAYRAGVRRPAAEHEVRFDWDDPSTWAAAADGVETVYLVKPPDAPLEPVTAFLAAAPGIRRVVLLSEQGREAKSSSDPDRAVELVVGEDGRRATILRPNWFFQNFGPEGGWGEALRDRGSITLPTGPAPLAWIDLRDVVEVAVRALAGEDLGPIDLTGAETFDVAELGRRIGAATGRPVVHDSPSLAAYRSALEATGPGAARLAFLMDLVTDAAEGRYARITDDLEQLLGRPPRSFDDYVAENTAYWRGKV